MLSERLWRKARVRWARSQQVVNRGRNLLVDGGSVLNEEGSEGVQSSLGSLSSRGEAADFKGPPLRLLFAELTGKNSESCTEQL